MAPVTADALLGEILAATQADGDPTCLAAELHVRVAEYLAGESGLSAAVSDILDRLDAGDQLYRELRDQVQRLARLVEPLPALEPEPRRVIGMRDKDGREWPDIWEAWAIEVAHGDRFDPAAWADYLPHLAPFAPVFEDAPEPVAEDTPGPCAETKMIGGREWRCVRPQHHEEWHEASGSVDGGEYLLRWEVGADSTMMTFEPIYAPEPVAEPEGLLDRDELTALLAEKGAECERLRNFVRKMLEAGTWFHSAIELHTHDGFDGEELESEARSLLNAALRSNPEEAETQDPREAVLREWQRRLELKIPYTPGSATVLRDVDAADPLRAMLGDVVAALVDTHAVLLVPRIQDTRRRRAAERIRRLLTRLRTLTPTEEEEHG